MKGISGALGGWFRYASILACSCILTSSTLAQSANDLEAAHAAMMADGDLQHEFIGYERTEPPKWFDGIDDFLEAIGRLLGPLIEIVFWVGIAALGAFILFALFKMLMRRFGGDNETPEEAPAEAYHPTPSFARALLEEADRLARAGDFAEAVHVLLFRSIEDIQNHRPHSLGVSLTSREISELDVLPLEARRQFAKIAEAVERGHFAGGMIGADIFASSRAAYLVFARSESWT